MQKSKRLASAVALACAVALTPALTAVVSAGAADSSPVVRCRAVSGAATIAPGLTATAGPQTVSIDSPLQVSECGTGGAGAVTAEITGSLQSASASCPPAPDDRFHGAAELDWSDRSTSYIQTARLDPTGDPDDPFAVRLHGLVSGGVYTGATLRVVLHLAPTQGDCASGVTAVGIGNLTALTIGGPYASCGAVSGAATISPGLSTVAGAQSLHFDGFRISACGVRSTARGANVIGALESDSVSCPPAPGERLHGAIEIDWSNHFVSIVSHVRLDSTNNKSDPFEARLHGRVKRGADLGATLAVVVHLDPTEGDCSTAVTAVAFTNVGPLTIT